MPIHYVVFIVSGTILGVWTVAWCIGRCCFNQYGYGGGGNGNMSNRSSAAV